MQFGDILRSLLEEKMITQKQMADDLNIAASTIGNYIRNLRQPDFDTVRRIAQYFGVSTDYLLNYNSDKEFNKLENDLLRVFRAMTPEQQKIYTEQGKAFLKSTTDNKK